MSKKRVRTSRQGAPMRWDAADLVFSQRADSSEEKPAKGGKTAAEAAREKMLDRFVNPPQTGPVTPETAYRHMMENPASAAAKARARMLQRMGIK